MCFVFSHNNDVYCNGKIAILLLIGLVLLLYIEMPLLYSHHVRGIRMSTCEAIFFFPGLFFIIFSYYCSFMVVWGFGVWFLFWVFGVGAFS